MSCFVVGAGSAEELVVDIQRLEQPLRVAPALRSGHAVHCNSNVSDPSYISVSDKQTAQPQMIS